MSEDRDPFPPELDDLFRPEAIPSPEDGPADGAEQLGLLPPEPPAVPVQEAPAEIPSTPETVPDEEPVEPKPLPQGEIIAMVNQKGGVGKTTSTINLGAALAEQGARVLLVDLDPQGALSVGLGLKPEEMELTVHNLLLEPGVGYTDIVQKSGFPGLDILPANIDLSVAELQLVSEVAREQILARKLAPAQQVYNYILIDCPPSLGLLTVNALTAATNVIIPLECEYFALRGLALLTDSISKIQERLNESLEIKGILATMLDSRTVHSREVLSRVADAYGDKLFKTTIRKTIRFAEAPVVGESILTYAPSSAGAGEYRDLAKEVMSR